MQMFTEETEEEGLDLCLIDGDSILYKISATSDSHIQARSKFNKKIKEIMENTEASSGLVAMKGDNNFRLDLTPDYKANRKKYPPKPAMAMRIKRLYTYCFRTGCIASEGCEADDMVAVWSAEATANNQSSVIAGIDKDLNQIPGYHYNYNKNTHYIISDEEAEFLLLKQMLQGDSGDNIMGLKGVGEKTAHKLLVSIPHDLRFDTVKRIWKEHMPMDWEKKLTLCTNLLYLRRNFEDLRGMELDEIFPEGKVKVC